MNTKFMSYVPKLAVALSFLAIALRTQAADQLVTDLGDSGGSNQLRAKITDCQITGGGKITFASAGTVTLRLGYFPNITSNVIIDGSNKVVISGNNDDGRIFIVNSGATFTLNKITVRDGYCSTGDGGAILSYGTLYVNNSKLFYNQTSPSWSGSAIHNWGQLYLFASEIAYNSGGGGAVKPRSSAALTSIVNCDFHDNESTDAGGGYGGAMQIFDGPSVIISSSSFTNNKAATEGGAIYVTANAAVTADKTTFTGNSTTVSKDLKGGGAISNFGTATLTKSTLKGNAAGDLGGGIVNHGNVSLTDVTLSANKASRGAGLENLTGAIATLTNVTVTGNSADLGGAS